MKFPHSNPPRRSVASLVQRRQAAGQLPTSSSNPMMKSPAHVNSNPRQNPKPYYPSSKPRQQFVLKDSVTKAPSDVSLHSTTVSAPSLVSTTPSTSTTSTPLSAPSSSALQAPRSTPVLLRRPGSNNSQSGRLVYAPKPSPSTIVSNQLENNYPVLAPASSVPAPVAAVSSSSSTPGGPLSLLPSPPLALHAGALTAPSDPHHTVPLSTSSGPIGSASSVVSTAAIASGVSSASLEERERAYEEARARIFDDTQSSVGGELPESSLISRHPNFSHELLDSLSHNFEELVLSADPVHSRQSVEHRGNSNYPSSAGGNYVYNDDDAEYRRERSRAAIPSQRHSGRGAQNIQHQSKFNTQNNHPQYENWNSQDPQTHHSQLNQSNPYHSNGAMHTSQLPQSSSRSSVNRGHYQFARSVPHIAHSEGLPSQSNSNPHLSRVPPSTSAPIQLTPQQQAVLLQQQYLYHQYQQQMLAQQGHSGVPPASPQLPNSSLPSSNSSVSSSTYRHSGVRSVSGSTASMSSHSSTTTVGTSSNTSNSSSSGSIPQSPSSSNIGLQSQSVSSLSLLSSNPTPASHSHPAILVPSQVHHLSSPHLAHQSRSYPNYLINNPPQAPSRQHYETSNSRPNSTYGNRANGAIPSGHNTGHPHPPSQYSNFYDYYYNVNSPNSNLVMQGGNRDAAPSPYSSSELVDPSVPYAPKAGTPHVLSPWNDSSTSSSSMSGSLWSSTPYDLVSSNRQIRSTRPSLGAPSSPQHMAPTSTSPTSNPYLSPSYSPRSSGYAFNSYSKAVASPRYSPSPSASISTSPSSSFLYDGDQS